MSHNFLRDWFWLVVVATGVEAQESAPVRQLKFYYGGGTPGDAGPLGHCKATFSSDGKVRIESKGREGVAGPLDAVAYETESLKPETLESILKAADAAF